MNSRAVKPVFAPPTFAISVPIGAWHPLLRDCLNSLAIQSPRPQVAVLDASGDPRVAEAVAEFPDLVVYHRDGPDEGQSDAIIEGWDHLSGDILGWLNADDALYPGALAEAAKRFSDAPDTDLFYGHSVINNDDDIIEGYHWAVEPPSEMILAGDIISQPSCFFKRSKLDEIGGLDRELHYTMDWDIWVRLWRAGGKFAYTENVLSRVLWSKDAKTGGFNRRRREELERIIGANNSLARRLKSRFGFALHHVLEYLAPDFVADFLRSAPGRKLRTINGLDRNGGFSGEAFLPLVHYADEPVTALEIDLRCNGPVALSAEGAFTEAATSGTQVFVFDTPVPAAKTVTLTLNAKDGPARLMGAKWCKA
ncbi:glycosyltransferase [Hyphococcus sp.]|uniref:glycosyltransferase n=1 Tax=Hyphococcus sp. TaxID=2038636 RepID=UPI0037529C86